MTVLEDTDNDDQIDTHGAASRDASASFLFVGSSASSVPRQAGASAVPGPEAYSPHSSPAVHLSGEAVSRLFCRVLM